MTSSMNQYEDILFTYAYKVKKFNLFISKQYKLIDKPYNVSGKAFPKVGNLLIDGNNVFYRFHGKGCSLNWNEEEIKFDIQADSLDEIIISEWSYRNYMKNFISNYQETDFPLSKIDQIFSYFEKKGAFSKRGNLENFYRISETWYASKFRELN